MDPQYQHLAHLTHIEHNMDLPSKSKTVTFVHFLVLVLGIISEKPNAQKSGMLINYALLGHDNNFPSK